jgi:CHAT domain-containing protein
MFSFSTSRFLSIVSGITVAFGACMVIRHYQRRKDTPEAILARADDLSWKNDWMEAAPLYQQAEQLFFRQNRASEALYAHVSQFIPRAESEPIFSLLVELQKDQSLPAARAPETRLRILVIQGMIETNYDASMARTTWEKVQTLARQQGHYLLMARAMGEQGIAAFLLGDFASAKRLVLRAWIMAKYLHDPAAHVRYASVYGAGLVELQRYKEAIKILDEAIRTAEESPGIAYPSIAVNSKIDALRGLHRYQEALTLADQAIERLPTTQLDAHLFQILTAKGEVYQDMGQWNDAAIQYGLALSYAHRLNYWRGITQTAGLLAEAHKKEGNLTAALGDIDQAIAANTKTPEELYFSPRNLAIKAKILEKMGDVNKSNILYQRSETLIDSLVATAPTPGMERELLTELGEVYSGLFASLSRQKNLAGAFQTIEKAHGRIEAQALEHHDLILPHDPTPREKQLTQLDLQLIQDDDPRARSNLAQTLHEVELKSDDSTLAGKTAIQPATLKTVQHHLGPAEVVIEYVLAEPRSYALAITSTRVSQYELSSKSLIEIQVSQYRDAIRNRRTDPRLAQTLFNELLAPIPEYRTKATVIVVPDGELHLLPFSALMDGDHYAISRHTFSTSPSSTVLSLLRDREKTTLADPLQYVGVAAWIQDRKKKNFLSRMISAPDVKQLQPLPESKEEVEAIAHDFPASSTVLLGADATMGRFKRLPLDEYQVLHLALHGYADLEYPDRSALVFAPERNGADDGHLEVREIRGLRLKARLVTLSACDTGVGPVGESGVANLVNAFIEAGAESVVSTLWKVEDRTTAHLMGTFYGSLAKHDSKAESLRNAQLDLLRSNLPPYYWASFEIVGDPTGTV